MRYWTVGIIVVVIALAAAGYLFMGRAPTEQGQETVGGASQQEDAARVPEESRVDTSTPFASAASGGND